MFTGEPHSLGFSDSEYELPDWETLSEEQGERTASPADESMIY